MAATTPPISGADTAVPGGGDGEEGGSDGEGEACAVTSIVCMKRTNMKTNELKSFGITICQGVLLVSLAGKKKWYCRPILRRTHDDAHQDHQVSLLYEFDTYVMRAV